MKYLLITLLVFSGLMVQSQEKSITVIATDTIILKPVNYIYIAQSNVDHRSFVTDEESYDENLLERLHSQGHENILRFLDANQYQFEVNYYEDLVQEEEYFNKQIQITIKPFELDGFLENFADVEHSTAYLSTTIYENSDKHYAKLVEAVMKKADMKAKKIAEELNMDIVEIIEFKELGNKAESQLIRLFSSILINDAPGFHTNLTDNNSIVDLKISVTYRTK